MISSLYGTIMDSIFKTYFNGYAIANDEKASPKNRTLAKICFASYFFILPPIICVIGLVFSSLYTCVWAERKVSYGSLGDRTSTKTQQQFLKGFSMGYPEVTPKMKPGFFVQVLNKNGYSIKGKNVIIPPAGKPEKFVRSKPLIETLENLRKEHEINEKAEIKFQFKDRTTEEAISEGTSFAIALNFANEHHAGGGPGFHKDPRSTLFLYDSPSAKAQEESICQRSNLMASLTQLPHKLRADPGTNFVRSYYSDEFDSREMAYTSSNCLFGIQCPPNFYNSTYLEEPRDVVFVTSAAQSYGNVRVDTNEDSEAYKDAKIRIETHLLAAASSGAALKNANPGKPVELILGAFGCGAFAPKRNPDEYRAMIADIYKRVLPAFAGFFDQVTFAVPTFGSTTLSDPSVANHRIFKRAFHAATSTGYLC